MQISVKSFLLIIKKSAQVKRERAHCHFKGSSSTGPLIYVVLGGPGGGAACGQKEKDGDVFFVFTQFL